MLDTSFLQILDNLATITYEDATWVSLRQLGSACAFGDGGSKLLERLRAQNPALTQQLVRYFTHTEIRLSNPYFPLPARSPGAFFIKTADIHQLFPYIPRFTSLGDHAITQDRTQGYLFFLIAPEVNRIRIGFSTQPYKDIAHIKSSSPCKLHRFKEVPGSAQTAQTLKFRFRKLKFNDDWFDLTPELSSFIREL